MTKDFEELKRHKVKALYISIEAFIRLTADERRAATVFAKLNKGEEDEKKFRGADANLASDFYVDNAPVLEDIKKIKTIKESQKTHLKNIIKDTKGFIPDELRERLDSEVDKHDINGTSEINNVIKDIENETGLEYGKSIVESKSYTVDDYFMDMSIVYNNISKALNKTLDDLELLVDELGKKIEKYNVDTLEKREELGLVTEVEEEKKPVVAEVQEEPKQSEAPAKTVALEEDEPQEYTLEELEAIEADMMFPDVYNEDDLEDDVVEEIIENNAPSADDMGFFGEIVQESKEKQSKEKQSKEEPEEESSGIKP